LFWYFLNIFIKMDQVTPKIGIHFFFALTHDNLVVTLNTDR